ncbi:MAG: hypothetical protein C0623_02025 [Desulfuromonas sp.]|nr:MAG: hypothetical protein C0623_02025 [Desulfuromonas sp.]
MTTLAVPYYGNLYHSTTGLERIFFIVNYDTVMECLQDIQLQVWDQNKNPELHKWLEENGVYGVVCRDPESMPLIEKVANEGITVLEQGSKRAQTIMKNLCM